MMSTTWRIRLPANHGETQMKTFMLAALLSVATLATPDTAQAGSGSFVWHHSTPIYVGKTTTTRTHGTTMNPRSAQVLRSWYSTRNNDRHQTRRSQGFLGLFGR